MFVVNSQSFPERTQHSELGTIGVAKSVGMFTQGGRESASRKRLSMFESLHREADYRPLSRRRRLLPTLLTTIAILFVGMFVARCQSSFAVPVSLPNLQPGQTNPSNLNVLIDTDWVEGGDQGRCHNDLGHDTRARTGHSRDRSRRIHLQPSVRRPTNRNGPFDHSRCNSGQHNIFTDGPVTANSAFGNVPHPDIRRRQNLGGTFHQHFNWEWLTRNHVIDFIRADARLQYPAV